MLDSKARIVEPPRRIVVPNGHAQATDKAKSFGFPVRWTSLFIPGDLRPVQQMPVTLGKSPTLRPSHAAPLVPISRPSALNSKAEWEMFVPRMDRSSYRLLAQAKPPAAKRHRVRWPRTASLAVNLMLSAAGIAALAVPVWMRLHPPAAWGSTQPTEGAAKEGGWIREAASPASGEQARKLVIYRPSLLATDCALDFSWKVSNRPLAAIFRAKDQGNYYAVGIQLMKVGVSPAFLIEHFAVYEGREGPHAGKVVLRGEDGPALPVRLEVIGATFKLYLDGHKVDSWSDRRLTAGGLGFLERPDQPVEVQSVRMSFSEAGGA